MAKILIVDDDRTLSSMVRQWLENERHSVEEVHNGADALDLITHYDFDLIILDWELPQLDGIEILTEFRARGGAVPILFLTGRKTIVDKKEGFEAGADDYLVKPFEMQELSLRIRALLRRPPTMQATKLTCGSITLDTAQGRVFKGHDEVKLFPKEYALLEFLLRYPNHVFSVAELLNHVWKSDSEATEMAVRTTLTRLRRKIQDDNGPTIATVHGLGYRLEFERKRAQESE